MNIIFLTMSPIKSVNNRSIYTDLMRKFRDEGHSVTIVTPLERRYELHTSINEEDGITFLGVRTLNLTKTNIIEKGIGQVLVEFQFKKAIKEYLNNNQYDLILYSTPPITLNGVVDYLKKKNPKAISYLLLKDIFPQNAVDLGMMTKSGVKGFLYKYFRGKEKKLYKLSDYIGCMSPANVDYLLKHNPGLNPDCVEVAPNSIELRPSALEPGQEETERYYIRNKYNLPTNKPLFIYGGNLGKPQGIPFLIKCLSSNAYREDCFFVIVGGGTELPRLQEWCNENKPTSVKVMNSLPKEDYDILVRSCDFGLIFLDNRFTIPNFPSRLLSYLENKMPVICATDSNTDMGRIAEANGFGYWCESNSVEEFTLCVNKMLEANKKEMGENGFKYLCNNYLIENTYNVIMKHF